MLQEPLLQAGLRAEVQRGADLLGRSEVLQGRSLPQGTMLQRTLREGVRTEVLRSEDLLRSEEVLQG